MTTEKFLLAVMPRAGANAAIWCEPLRIAAERYQINSPKRLAAWLATIGHETLDLTRLAEDLNYSADGLARTWPARFASASGTPNERALFLARKPVLIANAVYAGRMGNGPPESGDGWTYRGRGPLQCTGRDMYRRVSRAIGYNVLDDPDLLLQPVPGALSAGYIWHIEKHCNPLADQADVEAITRRINGGTVGLEDRLRRYAFAMRAMTYTV